MATSKFLSLEIKGFKNSRKHCIPYNMVRRKPYFANYGMTHCRVHDLGNKEGENE